MLILTTERVVLRPWRLQDERELFRYASDPQIGPRVGWKPHENLQESRHILKTVLMVPDVWALELRETGKPIGSIGLHRDRKRNLPPNLVRELGYWLGRPYWGQGLIPETARAVLDYAFSKLQLELVSCSHFLDNNQSRRVIEKLGFQYEGVLRQGFRIYDGSILDLVVYSLTRQEYAHFPKEPYDRKKTP